MLENPNFEISRKLQERFEFYFIALTFTILALSIQTASFGDSRVSDAFELSGWLLLFVSGVVALSRLEWLPVGYKYYAESQDRRDTKKELRQAQENGQQAVPVEEEEENIPIEEVILKIYEQEKELKKKGENIHRKSEIKYAVHKWTFVLGVLCVILSRGYCPALALIEG